MATPHIEDIEAGRKTLEGRLARGKFLTFLPGDIVRIREDLCDENGVQVGSVPDRLNVQVIGTEGYPSFESMLEAVGYQCAIPRANSLEEALRVYRGYYSVFDEQQFGVVAIRFHLIAGFAQQVREPTQ